MWRLKLYLSILLVSFFMGCNNEDENKVQLNLPELLGTLVNDSNRNAAVVFFGIREIDSSLTTNCGIASPGTAATTAVPGQTTQPTQDQGTSNTRFTVLSQLVIRYTGETLTMKFLYDTVQTQGALDQQQGFTLTGGVFNSTITGKQGTVSWSGQGAGYIDEANKGQQQLTFLNVSVNLRGFYSSGTSSTSQPLECFTQDSINCTTVTTSSKCFTQDNSKCVVGNATGQQVSVSGTIKCNAQNVIPQ